ncbi:hypothetical protein ACSSS7_007069 [Eimeria intestinalis]
MKQTLAEAKAKLAEKDHFLIGPQKKSYQETINHIQDAMRRTSTAIAALHKWALDELTRSGGSSGQSLPDWDLWKAKREFDRC